MGQIRSSLIYANPRFELCGIVDTNFDAASVLAKTYETLPFQTLDEAIDTVNRIKGPLDALIVSSSTNTHESVVKEAAIHQLDVFTEKPVDETADKIIKLFEIAERGDISLCCGFQRRFDASYVAAANAVQRGDIGTPVTANIFFADHPCPPKEFLLSGGNIFMDLSAHDLDYIMHALEDDVVSVYATGTSSTDELEAHGVHDNANVLMKFSRGTTVNLFMSRSATYGYDQRCEIFGSAGLVSVGNESAHSAVLSNVDGVMKSKLKHSFPQRFNQAFASELDAFANTLLLDTPWPVTADQCVRVQRVADAAKLSCDEDRVVQIPVAPSSSVQEDVPIASAI
jgi:myo-inositol 2-dehydrogenase/D-chiro-inositol 1-dehydrogenase